MADLQSAWATIATLAWWISEDSDGGAFMNVDDGERAGQTIGMIGCALLTMLETLAIAGKLQANSDFRDLGLVMALFSKWAHGLEDYGFEDEDDLAWRGQVKAYAKKAQIDLTEVGPNEMAPMLTSLGDQKLGGKKTGEKWEWSKKVRNTVLATSSQHTDMPTVEELWPPWGRQAQHHEDVTEGAGFPCFR